MMDFVCHSEFANRMVNAMAFLTCIYSVFNGTICITIHMDKYCNLAKLKKRKTLTTRWFTFARIVIFYNTQNSVLNFYLAV